MELVPEPCRLVDKLMGRVIRRLSFLVDGLNKQNNEMGTCDLTVLNISIMQRDL